MVPIESATPYHEIVFCAASVREGGFDWIHNICQDFRHKWKSCTFWLHDMVWLCVVASRVSVLRCRVNGWCLFSEGPSRIKNTNGPDMAILPIKHVSGVVSACLCNIGYDVIGSSWRSWLLCFMLNFMPVAFAFHVPCCEALLSSALAGVVSMICVGSRRAPQE